MTQRTLERLPQVLTDVIHAPQTSVMAAGGTISASAAVKLDYINSYGSTIGIYIGVALSLLLIAVQVIKLRNDLKDRRVRIANATADRIELSATKASHDQLVRKKLELEISQLERGVASNA